MPKKAINVRQHRRTLNTGRTTNVQRHRRLIEPRSMMSSTTSTPQFDAIKKAKNEHREYDLTTRYDGRQSFYGKAVVIVDGDTKKLRSYNTIVAEIRNGKAKVFGTYSQTTLRHIKEFLKQEGFRAETSKQIMEDYGN